MRLSILKLATIIVSSCYAVGSLLQQYYRTAGVAKQELLQKRPPQWVAFFVRVERFGGYSTTSRPTAPVEVRSR